MDPDAVLPPTVERLRVEVPEDKKLLSIFTDVFDCFFRFLAANLAAEGILEEDDFWRTVAEVTRDYQHSVPELADKFNKSQSDYAVRPIAKGGYDDVVNSMIAAYRAKQQPAIVQVNERGFLTMLNSNAIIPTAELMPARATRSTGRTSSRRSRPITPRTGP